LQEYIALGQRVQAFSVEAEVAGEWIEIDRQTTIGYKRILRFDTVNATGIRVNILEAKGSPAISNLALYHAPHVLAQPVPKRNKAGMVSFEVSDKNIEVYYTRDGTTPTRESSRYAEAFLVDGPTMLKAISVDPSDDLQTEAITKYFDLNKKEWKVTSVSSGDASEAVHMIDDNPETFWATAEDVKSPQEVIIDLGSAYELKGFTYWPIQERWSFGIITDYEFSVSSDSRRWRLVASGEFSNVLNNPIEQTVRFDAAPARFIKIKALKVGKGQSGTEGDYRASFGEIGVITSDAVSQ
ncbi:MAG: discoidin domain-containing protein, partial [Rhodothermales bacterium]